MNDSCIFCMIVGGQIGASKIYEDADVLAFLDIRPVTNGHALVIPKRHAAYLAELEPSDGGRLFQVGQQIASAQREATGCEGINFHLADGEVAGQEIFHVHLHVIPRYPADGFGLRHPPGYGSTEPPREQLEEMARALRGALATDP